MKERHIDETLDRLGPAALIADQRRHAEACPRCARALAAAEAAREVWTARAPVPVPRGFAAAVTMRLRVAGPGLFRRAWSASRGMVYAFAAACMLLLMVSFEDRDPVVAQKVPLADLLEDADGNLD